MPSIIPVLESVRGVIDSLKSHGGSADYGLGVPGIIYGTEQGN